MERVSPMVDPAYQGFERTEEDCLRCSCSREMPRVDRGQFLPKNFAVYRERSAVRGLRYGPVSS
jgi:aspartate/tyrosine/aromatic aminotransferase